MPIVKPRGKSSIITSTLNAGNSASPLKIESVLPTVNRSSSKSIYRSYSTLSSGYFKKPLSVSPTTSDTDHRLQNAQNRPSGFWHIQRTAKEKEKLPDRINLDRRGLTALPVIDDEPQLRLLSLQHNLINSFSVPEIVDKVKTLPNRTEESDPLSPANDSSNRPVKGVVSSKRTHLVKNSRIGTLRSQNKHLQSSNFKCPTSAALQPTHQPNTLHPNPIVKNSFIQKSVLLHAKEKYVFRKSNSFINSYSRHLAASKVHLGYLMDPSTKTNSNISFSTDSSVSDLESKTTTKPASPLNSKPPVTSATSSKIVSPPTGGQNYDSVRKDSHLQNLMIHNEHLPANNLQNLVFIDLYDNQIEKISSLEGLKSLTVLLLGKNRISDISGLISVKKTLRVLDLHGNKITGISQKICQLQELKSLNLAGNSLKTVYADDFKGLFNLRELNLKRNHIKRINGFEDLRHLERLWLCHNDLQKIEDMSCIAKAVNLKEVTLENNPVSLGGDCVSFLVSYLPCIVLLSQMQVTEQVRRAAMAWRLSKETSDANYSHLSNDVSQNQRREEIISNARTNWELLRSQQHIQATRRSTAQGSSNQLDGKTPQHSAPVADVDADTCSDVSESIKSSDRKSAIIVAKQKTISNRIRSLKKTFQGRTQKRSVSHEHTTPDGEGADKATETEYFRLPPILATFLVDGGNEKVSTSSASESSLSPNVDSSSSCISSDNDNNKDDEFVDTGNGLMADKFKKDDQIISEINEDCVPNEDEPDKKLQETQLYSEEAPKELPTKSADVTTSDETSALSQPKPDTLPVSNTEDTNSDKNSDISFNSNKSTISELVFDESTKSSKCRSAFSNRRYVSPLARAQTARNTNSNGQPTSSNQPLKNGPKTQTIAVTNERDREQGGDYLIEICGRYLNVYGAGAIKFIDRQWNVQKAADVHTFKFSYIHFNSIASMLGKVKVRFPNAENFIFRETNINCLGQLNALAEIQGIHSLTIDPEGNLVCTKPEWRLYAIYRLSHWDVKIINGEEVTEQEVADAQQMYAGLSKLVLWSLPDALLEPLLARLHLDESCAASRMSPKQWLMQADESLRNVVGKEALQWKKTMVTSPISGSALGGGASVHTGPDEALLRQQGKEYFKGLMENTCNSTEKLNKLETLWPSMLVEMIRNTLLDYAQLDVYVRNLMIEMVDTIPKTGNTTVASSSWRIPNNQ